MVSGAPRYFNGIITRFAQTGGGAAFAMYEAELRPQCMVMALATNRCIFQNKTVPQIVQTLLGNFSVTYSASLTGSYTERVYCVQYDETTLDFIERILAEEGIY
jgi:type VI secretion system secreted protein VgrG